MTHIREIAKFIVAFDLTEVSPPVIEAAKFCLVDTIGVALGASTTEKMDAIYHQSLVDESINSGASVWGRKEKLPPETAALYNAMMAHFLELDDVHPASKTHIGTVVIPAAWALAEYVGASGAKLLESVICGYEVTSRIGMGIGVKSHRERGWHATGTAGTFGAAAACAKLLGLSEEQTVYALGLAGTQSSGLWSFLEDGANAKILHAGAAARSGMTAALMAKSGVQGAEHVLDAKDGGMFPAMSDNYDYSLVAKDLGQRFEILNVENKPYPCCRSTHCAIDAALSLRSKTNFSLDAIRQIDIATYLVAYRQCGSLDKAMRPATTTEAKFSLPYAVSCALLYGEVGEKYFYEPYLGSQRMMDLCKKVNVYPDVRFTTEYPARWGCEMSIAYNDGGVHIAYVGDPLGSKGNPIDMDGLMKKVMPAFIKVYGKNAQAIVEEIMSVDTLAYLPSLSRQA